MIVRGAAVAVVLAAHVSCAWAGTTGTICGRVTGPDGGPVDLVTVMLTGKEMGNYSDAGGNYCIVNVPPGTYDVSVSRLGFQPTRVKDVAVSADQTTRLDIALVEQQLGTEEVVVESKRPPVDLNLTSTAVMLSSKEIEELPVQELDDVVNLQAGVVEGHFRGGRLGEVQYQVDGVTVNNAFDNRSMLQVDRSLLQEVQVISGTFDAEYGQAMSGVVNAVLKEGTPELRWSAEFYTGAFLFSSEDRAGIENEIRPAGLQSYQGSVRGPLPFPRSVFLVSGRRYIFDDYVYGSRVFVPTDSSDFEHRVWRGTGDSASVALGTSREWSGLLKLTSSVLSTAKANYQLFVEDIEGTNANYDFHLNPDGEPKHYSVAVSHGFDWIQTLGPVTVLALNLRQNYYHFREYVYEDVYDSRYDAAGRPLGDRSFELGAYVQGVSFARFEQETNGLAFKGSITTQKPGHGIKAGGELYIPRVAFGVPGYLTYATVGGEETLVRHVNEPPDYPGVQSYYPVFGAGFVQDQVVLGSLTLRAGLRFDYFDARSTVPSDLANPANAIEDVPESHPQDTTTKTSLSPRLGVAYPVLDQAALHFAYGHFRQFPSVGQIFTNADYSVLADLQAGVISYGVMGNPDIGPEETVQYEAGYKQAIDPNFGIDVTTFYKDIRSLLGVEFISTYNGAEYARLTNVDFGDVLGVTVSIDHHALGPVGLALDYTWQQALGNSSDPRETAVRASAGADPRPRLVPFDWDQRHTLNVTVSMDQPGNYQASAVLRVGSGQPYTPILSSGFGGDLETNSGRKPSGAVLDMRFEKRIPRWGANTAFFTRVFNLTDTRFFNGPVFPSTGSVDYSRFPIVDAPVLANPTRYYAPRRIEVGLRFGSEGPWGP